MYIYIYILYILYILYICNICVRMFTFPLREQGVSQKFPISAVKHKLGISELWNRGLWGPTLKGPNGIWGKASEKFGYLTLIRL